MAKGTDTTLQLVRLLRNKKVQTQRPSELREGAISHHLLSKFLASTKLAWHFSTLSVWRGAIIICTCSRA
jgi:hypothetical protein